MLLEPVADDFNSLLMQPPVRRVISVAEALTKAAAINGTVDKMLRSTEVIRALREEGRARGAGDIVVAKAFTPDFDRHLAREAPGA